MAFFYGFLDAPPTQSFTATLISVQMNGVEVGNISTKFHLHGTCNSGVLIFEMLVQQPKVPFQAASGWFYGFPKYSLIGFKFSPVIKCHLMHQMIESFYNILNKWSKLGQKVDFGGNFQRFFINALSRPSSRAPIFTPNQRSYEDTQSW